MSRRSVILLVAVVLVVAAASAVAASRTTQYAAASYTTTSQSDVTASATSVTGWLNVYSEGSDPGGLNGYARQQDLASQPLIAGGRDAGLTLEWGSYPDLSKTFAFERVLTIQTPTVFPDPSVAQVTVSVTLAPDPGGTQPLRKPSLHLVGQAGTSTSVTLGVNAKAQLDVQLRTKKNPWDDGDEFRPHVVLTLTYAGGPAAYYVYDFATLLTII